MIKSIKNYNTVLFDMDGVVVDSMPFHALAWQRAYEFFGYRVDKIDIYKREGVPGRASIIDILTEKKIKIPDDVKLKEIQNKKTIYFKEYNIKIFPMIIDILSKLSEYGLQMGLVTGSNKISIAKVLEPQIKSYFKIIISGDDVKKGKPDPEPYLKALNRLNANIEQTLVIENAPMGIRAAKKAGLDCIALETSLPGKFLKEADKIIYNHKQLIKELKI